MNAECEQLEELLSAYLDREVSAEEQSRVESHLVSCPACAEELKALKSTQALVRSLGPVEVPRDLWSRIQRELHPKVLPFRVRFARDLVAVAASVLIFFSFITLLGYFAPEPTTTKESSVYLGSHAYHLMRQPLADHSSWSYVAGESNFDLLASQE